MGIANQKQYNIYIMKIIVLFLLCIILIYIFYLLNKEGYDNIDNIEKSSNNIKLINEYASIRDKTTILDQTNNLPSTIDRFKQKCNKTDYKYCYNGSIIKTDIFNNITKLENGENYDHGKTYKNIYDDKVYLEDYNYIPNNIKEIKGSSKTRDVYYDINNKCNKNTPWYLDLSSNNIEVFSKNICSSDKDIRKYDNCLHINNICPKNLIETKRRDKINHYNTTQINNIINTLDKTNTPYKYVNNIIPIGTYVDEPQRSFSIYKGNEHNCESITKYKNVQVKKKIQVPQISTIINKVPVYENQRYVSGYKTEYYTEIVTKKRFGVKIRVPVIKTRNIPQYKTRNIETNRYTYTKIEKTIYVDKYIYETQKQPYNETICQDYNEETCKQECKDYNYFSLQGKDKPKCFCENSFEKATKYGKSQCVDKGSNWCNYIYKNNHEIITDDYYKVSKDCTYDDEKKQWILDDNTTIKELCQKENCNTKYYRLPYEDKPICYENEAEASYEFDKYNKTINSNKYPFDKTPTNPIQTYNNFHNTNFNTFNKGDKVKLNINKVIYDTTHCNIDEPYLFEDKCYSSYNNINDELDNLYTFNSKTGDNCKVDELTNDISCENLYMLNESDSSMSYNPITNNFIKELVKGDYSYIDCSGGKTTQCLKYFPYIKNSDGNYVLDISSKKIEKTPLNVYEKPHPFIEQDINPNMMIPYNNDNHSKFIRCVTNYNLDNPIKNMCPKELPKCDKYSDTYGLCTDTKDNAYENLVSYNENNIQCKSNYNNKTIDEFTCPYNLPYCHINKNEDYGFCRNNNDVYKRPQSNFENH